MRLPIALVVWAAAVIGAVALSSSVAHTVHTDQAKAAKAAVSVSKPTVNFNPASVKPADPRSLFVGSNFAHVLALVRRHVGAHANLEMLELFPGQLELTVRQPAAELSVIARVNGEYLSSSDSNVSSSTQVFGLSQIHADVPTALARRVAAHGGVAVSGLNFLSVRIDAIQHLFHWYVYPQRPNLYFQADSAHGPIQEFNHGRPGKVIRGL